MLGHQEKFVCFGYKLPTYFWFVISGAICDILQALIDYGISLLYTIQWERATVCWTASYTLSIWIRHWSHRLLVFGEYDGTYCASLCRTYAAYSTSILLSAFLNSALVAYGGLTHKEAWLLTMLGTGLLNYYILKRSWRSGNADSAAVVGGLESRDGEKLQSEKLVV